MLRPYTGEFLLIPIPMELSMDLCSHSCHYCFANLNVPNRKGNPNQVLKVLSNAHKKKDILSILINERYPVLISNLVDPFSKNNHKKMIPLINTINDMGIPIAFQTKGGYGLEQVVYNLPKSHWYITIESDNDKDGKKLSPGAPNISDRLKLVKFLKDSGHIVDVGINPFIPEYFKDIYKFIDDLIEMKVDDIIIQVLHLNKHQIKSLSIIGKERFTMYLNENDTFYKKCYNILRSIYTQYFNKQDTLIEMVDYPDPHLNKNTYSKVFNKLFPIMNDFLLWCYKNKEQGQEVYFDEFKDVLGFHRLFSEDTLFLQAYLSQSFEGIRKLKMLPTYLKMDDILKIIWNDKSAKLHPMQTSYFNYLVDNKQTNIYDNNGNIIFTFNKE